MDLGISGRRAAVAAASQGLGYSVAAALAAEGVQVAICSRRAWAVTEAATRIGHGAIPIVADVSDPEGATEFVRRAREALGGIDILVPNAGGPPAATFATASIDEYLAAFELNCRSAIAMCIAAVPEMQAQHWGRIVAITSVFFRQSNRNLILSNTARAGLTGFLKTVAGEVARDGVTVNSLLPGYHRTQRLKDLHADDALENLASAVPVGVLGDPDDFGRVAAFLCSEHARYITGAALQVDGGSYTGVL